MLYTGVIENRNDPLKLGRCQVRVVGLHTDDKNILPTEDLPWAHPLQPITSAAMNGIGQSPTGVVPGTWVVIMFSDGEDQQQPIILGSLGGIYLTKNASITGDSGDIAVDETPSNALKDSSGNVVTDGSGQPILTTPNPEPPAPEGKPAASTPTAQNLTSNDAIPTKPPANSVAKGSEAKAEAGIKALIAACDKVGLTTRYAKAALLGIAGGESTWIPQNEAYNYSPERMKQIFKSVSEADIAKYSYAQKKGMTRKEFFSFFYGPTFRGKNFLGNVTDEDGGKYYGRGFIQLTGKGNYEQYKKITGLDIIGNPDLLDTDLEGSALIAATYLTRRVNNWQKLMYDDAFFGAAKSAVGVNSPDIATKKKTYYEYFMNGAKGADTTNKEASAGDAKPTEAEIAAAPPEKREALREDRSSNAVKGFVDPDGKYPLRDYANEPDTNRLARGVLEGTCFEFKDQTLVKDVPLANGGSWSQPNSAYSSVYPYNKVMETESGHILEFDDTPAAERIHLYHRKGTFFEIDQNGSRVTHIVGDDYHICDRNGNIYFAGNVNITAGTGAKILVRGDAELQVEGKTNAIFQNDVSIGAANNVDMVIGKDFNVKVNGNMQFDVVGTTSHVSKGIMNFQGAGNINMVSAGNLTTKVSGNIGLGADGNMTQTAGGSVGIGASGSVDIKAGGIAKLDGSLVDLGNGASVGTVSKPEAVKNLELTPPEIADVGGSPMDNLEPPERTGLPATKFETPEDWNSPAGQSQAGVISSNPQAANPANSAENSATPEFAAPAAGNSNQGTPVNKDTYKNADPKAFTRDYKISKNFTIGHLMSFETTLQDTQLPPGQGDNFSGLKLFTKADLVANLADLANNIGEPLWDLLGPPAGKYKVSDKNGRWMITSGLRNAGSVAGSRDTSDHNKGRAMDFQLWPGGRYLETLEFASKIEKILPYNQIILEYRDPSASKGAWQNWIHVSYRAGGNLKQGFTMLNDKTVDANGNVKPGTRGFYLFGPK